MGNKLSTTVAAAVGNDTDLYPDLRLTSAADASTAPTSNGGTSGSPSSSDAEERQEEAELPLDLVFDILKNERRRRVLRYLQKQDGPVSLGEVAEHIAALENETTVDKITSTQRKRVYVGLYQLHLPKMNDAGVVEYNQGRGIITLAPQAKQLEHYLDSDEDVADSSPWTKTQLSLAVVGVVLSAVVGTGVLSHSLVTDVALLGIFLGVAAATYLQHGRKADDA